MEMWNVPFVSQFILKYIICILIKYEYLLFLSSELFTCYQTNNFLNTIFSLFSAVYISQFSLYAPKCVNISSLDSVYFLIPCKISKIGLFWRFSRARHKNIVSLIGICFELRQPYIVNEYVDGESLKDLLIKEGETISMVRRVKMVRCTSFSNRKKEPIQIRVS